MPLFQPVSLFLPLQANSGFSVVNAFEFGTFVEAFSAGYMPFVVRKKVCGSGFLIYDEAVFVSPNRFMANVILYDAALAYLHVCQLNEVCMYVYIYICG